MEANEMIERYVHEVGRKLPRKGRTDIEQELRSLLHDAVEERAGGAEPTEQTVVKALLDFGSPDQIAAEYQPQRYVIGPQLYPFFGIVARIVPAAMAVAFLVLMILTLVTGDGADPVNVIWSFLLEYVKAAIVSLGIVALIFAAIERFWGDEIANELDSAEWDPYSLPAVDDPDRINRGEELAEIIATIVFVGIFLALIRPDGLLAPFVAEEVRPIIPWIVASTAIDVVLQMMVLWQGRWTRSTRVLQIGSEMFGLYVLYLLLTVGAITTIPFINLIMRFGLFIAFIVDAISIVVKIVQLFTRRRLRLPTMGSKSASVY